MQDKLYDIFKEHFDLIPNNNRENIDDAFNELKSIIKKTNVDINNPENFKNIISEFLIEKFEKRLINHILDGVITS